MSNTKRAHRWVRWMVAAAALAAAPTSMAAFSLTTRFDSNNASKVQYEIDTNAGLVVKIRGYDNGVSTQSAGDISSLVYNGVQYADQSRGSQLNSGFDYLYKDVSAVAVSAEMVSGTGAATPASTAQNGVLTGGSYIKVTVTSHSNKGGTLKHYYLFKSGQPHVYMGTWFTEEPDTLNLVRYIVRVPIAALPNGPDTGMPGGRQADGSWPQDLRGTDTTVEASDVSGFSSATAMAGQTRSKHYSNMRLRDWKVFGGRSSGNTVGLWFYRDGNEGNSGGPFYRSLLNQITATTNELTYIVNYGEGQTEAFRVGVLNTYTLMFNNGSVPAAPDTSWFSLMGMDGFVPASGRGTVAGVGVSGMLPGYRYTVALSGSTGQYWADADPANNGFFTITGVLPGSYQLTVYKNELKVYSGSVSVTAGNTTALNTIAINMDPESTAALWRIGQWDGQPVEFLNGDKLTVMHPSDVRMSPWTTGTFVVGLSSAATDFPAYQWKAVNNGRTISFNLAGSEVSNLTLRVGTTTEFNSARPQVSVNGVWTSAVPPAPAKTTRNLTVGTYRGVNRVYSFDIPANAFVAGTNTVTISAVSGTAATGYLSPGLSYDAVDLVVTP